MRTFDKKSTWLKNKELNREQDLVTAINVLVILVFGIINLVLLFNLY